MPLSLRGRMARVLASRGLAAALMHPGRGAGRRRRNRSCRVGTDQDLEVLNPWHSVTGRRLRDLQLNYDLLVGFGQNLEPVPGFAESWTQLGRQDDDTFKIRAGHEVVGRRAGDVRGRPLDAPALLDGVASERGYVGSGYLEPYLTNAGVTAVTARIR